MDDQFSTDTVNALSAADFAGQRNGSRDSLMLTAQFRVAGDDRTAQVRVRNLSSGGLMAEYAAPVEIRTPVEIEVRGVGWVKGRIAWATDGRVGVAFDIEIDPMLARKPVGKGAPGATYAKPVLTRR
ncbi:PilZ domain-containing protein [Sphingomonas psychrotolerans]|uniref:PilZ domain-containing protein n=1 Tax=Sphingomonas psychrotolerans TaxID=1327635 RepID=A0ABU3MZW0_9SPHN|nr:PilZ domain-containing protein [Sphingomonas psychrotolerans]MDT8757658.1 PilZ domain-containing protein [Sphingomonas psychrotolerans]